MIPWQKFLGFAALIAFLEVTFALIPTWIGTQFSPSELSYKFSQVPFGKTFVEYLHYLPLILLIFGFIFIYKSYLFRTYFFIALMVLFALKLLFLLFGDFIPYLPHVGFYFFITAFNPIVILSLLFWIFVNQSFTLQEAKLSYPLLLAIGGFSGYIAALIYYFTKGIEQETLFILMLAFSLLFSGFLCWIFKKQKIGEVVEEERSAENVSVKSYLFMIGLIVLLFTLSQQFLYLTLNSEHARSSNLESASQFPAIAILFVSIPAFLSTFWMIRKFGWYKSALITPIFLLIASLCLTICHFGLIDAIAPLFHISPPYLSFYLVLGIIGVLNGLILSVLFPTKQISFMALPLNPRAKGNAVVYVCIYIYSIFFGGMVVDIYHSFFSHQPIGNSVQSSDHLIWPVILLSLLWILAVKKLSRIYTQLTGEV